MPYAVRIKSNILSLSAQAKDSFHPAIDDFIIVKQNGWPSHAFSEVIDDYLMKITHVLKEETLLKEFHEQIFLYKLLKI